MRIFSVVGTTGTGKTTVIEGLIRELCARGYTVGSVKEIHFDAFRIDTEGKNTWRHRQAGAKTVTARAHHETDIMLAGHADIDVVLANYTEDWVVLEGVRDAVVPEIAVCKEEEQPTITPTTVAISGRYANNGISEYQGLPVFNGKTEAAKIIDLMEKITPTYQKPVDPKCCSVCGTDCERFLSQVLKSQRPLTDCTLRTPQQVTLTINHTPITLVPFVQAILKNTLLATVSELNGYKPNTPITLEVK